MSSPVRLVTFCNPLLDITATVNEDFLDKYALARNDAIMSDPERHGGLLSDLLQSGHTVRYSAGGAGQNSARAAQAILRVPGSSAFIGCVGEDEHGALLAKVAAADGLHLAYMKMNDQTAATGTCVCLLTRGGQDRSLVATLGAANHYRLSHLISDPQVHGLLDSAKIFYITGFFMTVSPQTIQYVAEYAWKHGKTLALNLSAPFLSLLCLDTWRAVMPYVGILFGNETEAVAYAEAIKSESTDIAEIAKEFAAWPFAGPKDSSRLVVITQGSNPTILATSNQQGTITCTTYPVTPIPKDEIVDTTGAGDAFVGGFLGRMVADNDASLEACVLEGHQLASSIIRILGVSFN